MQESDTQPTITSETLLAHVDAILDDAKSVQSTLDSQSASQQVAAHIKRSQTTVKQLILCNKRYYEQLCELQRTQ